MKTTIKRDFDAVAESHKWREKTSVLLSTMSPAERIAFLNRRIADFGHQPGRQMPRVRPAD
jgi:hypothetical protein